MRGDGPAAHFSFDPPDGDDTLRRRGLRAWVYIAIRQNLYVAPVGKLDRVPNAASVTAFQIWSETAGHHGRDLGQGRRPVPNGSTCMPPPAYKTANPDPLERDARLAWPFSRADMTAVVHGPCGRGAGKHQAGGRYRPNG